MVCQHTAMSTNDGGAVLACIQWGEEGSYVREIASRGALPQLAKVIKGQYLGIGVPSLASPSAASSLLLLSGGKVVRVAAQCVKFKEGRRVVPVGPRLAIPESYDGFFEILSEDGRAVRCMESVSELARRFPDSCLVRESLKAYVSKSDDVDTIMEKSRQVHVGETLVLVGEVVSTKARAQHRFLRCFDQTGQNLYLPFDAKGKFSAIAKEDNISGVHSIRNLLNKRLPLMVRLIHGKGPVGTKVSSQFLPELRLFGAFSEDALAALPLGKDLPLVLLPPSAPLKLTHAKNGDLVEKTKEFLRLCEKSNFLLQEFLERIHVYDVTVGSKTIGGIKDPRFHHITDHKHRPKHIHANHGKIHKMKSPPDKNAANNKNSNGALDDYDEIDQIYDYVRGFAPLPKHIKSPYADKEPVSRKTSHQKAPEKNENRPAPPPIETIPTRKDPRQITYEKLSPSVHPALISAALERAERKVEKRTRSSEEKKFNSSQPHVDLTPLSNTPVKPIPDGKSGNNKLFIKASQQQKSKSRMFRHKSASPVKEAIMDVVNSGPSAGLSPSLSVSHIPGQVPVHHVSSSGTSPSPLFRMRYKSLTNLVMDFDTLDSSTSGGKGSSCGDGSVVLRAKPPAKKVRGGLTRPKSLTNLVWDGRGPLMGGDGSSNNYAGPGRALLEAERKLRLEPGVYRHAKDAPALLAATTRMLQQQRKVGTLYL